MIKYSILRLIFTLNLKNIYDLKRPLKIAFAKTIAFETSQEYINALTEQEHTNLN